MRIREPAADAPMSHERADKRVAIAVMVVVVVVVAATALTARARSFHAPTSARSPLFSVVVSVVFVTVR